MQCACTILSCVTCPALAIFLYFISQTAWFSKKKSYWIQKCVFRCSLYLLSETYFILRITERDVLKKMYVGLYIKYPLFLSDLNKTCIYSAVVRKIRKYQTSYKSVQREPSNSMRTDGRMDGRRDRHDKDNSRFSQFCGRTKQGFPTTRIINNSPCSLK